ncbi:Protein FAR1-RELATED SEQUENCE [Abeliophyllum distichum]|uniref:Protein FAR1-RELATED SEQUENCE n=1 Tax=Abeliophyllum distichum TaxID=126358 RepID=A0ABD1RW21_9LAMI
MKSESADNIFIPQVSNGRIPIVGQEFESNEAAYGFYNQYAREAGFSTQMSNSKKKKDTKETYWKMFVFSKEGKLMKLTNGNIKMRCRELVKEIVDKQDLDVVLDY